MAMYITDAMEWVTHERGVAEETLARKYQKACWDRLFGGRKLSYIVYELNTRWLPDGKKIVLLNPSDPVELVSIVQELLVGTDYEVKLTIKEPADSQGQRFFKRAV